MNPKTVTPFRLTRPGSLLVLAIWASTALALPGKGGEVDAACAGLGYPLAPQFEPQVAGDCAACHDNGASGPGDGRTAFDNGDWEFFCPAPEMNLPPVANANGPYAGEVDQPISFSSAGSADMDGMIVSYVWDFGDGTSSTEPNPTHAYTSAMDYSVLLTVTDDFGDSHTGSTSASVSAPAINEPDIQLESAALDFHQNEIGTTATLATTVRNTGSQVLSVTSILACAGTSSEFSWSPSMFEVEPGGSLALSVMYTPVDDLSDAGCLEIMSNDPDESRIELSIAGVGYIPAPVVSDLDISRFAASKRARVGQRRPINVQLVVTNPGLDVASADALLTGTQNGAVVYEEHILAEALAGGQARLSFPPFMPTDSGDIEWRVSITDDDQDIDEAASMTRVVTPRSTRGGRRER